MTKKILTAFYAGLWVFMAWALYSDMYIWRPDEPKRSGAQIEAAEQAKKYYKDIK
jgi:CHASE2 domain-containing sensor protein